MARTSTTCTGPTPDAIPVYSDGKLIANVIGGKFIALKVKAARPVIPVGQRRLRHRCREYEAGVTCYFIGGEDGPVKIGYTDNLPRRLAALRGHSPIPLSVLATTGGGIFAEMEYHDRFSEHRLHGEWFSRSPAILEEIARLNQENS